MHSGWTTLETMKPPRRYNTQVTFSQKYNVGDAFVDIEYNSVTIVVGDAYLCSSRLIGEAIAVHYPCIQKTGWSTGEAFVRVEELERYLDKTVRISIKDEVGSL